MLKYMEEGITDKEISFTINSNRVGFKKRFLYASYSNFTCTNS